MYDINQAREFIKALTGSEDTVVTFQSFFDPKGQEVPKGIAEIWHSTVALSDAYIDHKQSQLAGIYVCINGTDLKGREIYNINNLRVLFADFDGQTEPTWVLPPHFTQARDETHGHAFWLIDSGDLTHEEWSILQKQIALFYNTDQQVVDPCRVVRLAGSIHYKNPQNPQVYRITSNRSQSIPKYTIDQIRQAHALPADKDAILNQWAEARAGINTGVGYEDNTLEIQKFISFVKNAAHPAVLGSGTHELYRVACYGHDHGVSLENAKQILWEHYNPRCLPPWTEDERNHFDGVVYRGYHYATSAAGCKTARAQFQALPPLPEPNCGWDNQSKQFNNPIVLDEQTISVRKEVITTEINYRSDFRLSKDQALVLASQLTMKSSHYDFAKVFDGVNYDGVGLIRCDKQYYRYTGRSWSKVSDEVIKAEILRAFSVYKPADSFTSGVFRVLHDIVNVESVEKGTWLSGRKSSPDYTVFRNGIVDLNAKDITLIEHTPEFFTLTELDYDFEPDAKCPEFLKFLDSIWSGNEKLKMQLQEFMGYCLTSDISLQKFAVLTGLPRAGKGTITTIMRAMVGPKNTAAPALEDLSSSSALTEMSTKSLTLIPDAHSVGHSVRDGVLSKFKAITGGDPVSFHEIYIGSRNEVFKTKIVVSTNNVPEFNDPSGALANRMLVFPFNRSFAGKEDFTLGSRLMNEISGITQWAVEGLRRLRANGGRFTEAEIGLAEKEYIRKSMFTLAEYVEDVIVIDTNSFTMVDDLYASYRLWAATEGIKTPMTKTTFERTMRNSALPIRHDAERKGFTGLTVRSHMAMSSVVPFPAVK